MDDEIPQITEWFDMFGEKLPTVLWTELDALRTRLGSTYGARVRAPALRATLGSWHGARVPVCGPSAYPLCKNVETLVGPDTTNAAVYEGRCR